VRAAAGWTTPIFEQTVEYLGGDPGWWEPHLKLALLVAIEHVLLCCKALVAAVVPDVPERVANAQRRRQWLAAQAEKRQ